MSDEQHAQARQHQLPLSQQLHPRILHSWHQHQQQDFPCVCVWHLGARAWQGVSVGMMVARGARSRCARGGVPREAGAGGVQRPGGLARAAPPRLLVRRPHL
jgi:hypothetical protein